MEGHLTSTYDPRYQMLISKLRDARREMGLTQAEVARRLRRPQSFVSKVESGERRIDPVELYEFACLYKAEIEYFFTFELVKRRRPAR